MRLISLYVEKYKNLKKFTVSFEKSNHLSVFMGANGSGKSTILEVVGDIFSLLLDDSTQVLFDFKLQYEINNRKIEVVSKGGKLEIKINDTSSHLNFLRQNNLVPDKLLALYSGEEDRLWEKSFYEPYNKYISGIYNSEIGQMLSLKHLYINKYYWDIALFSLILAQRKLEDVHEILMQQFKIDETTKIILNIDESQYEQCKNELLKSFLDRLMELGNTQKDKIIFELNDSFYAIGDNYSDSEIVRYLIDITLPKEKKIITDIEIIVNSDFSSKMFSEGQKRMILLYWIFELATEENSLILLDEPDSHIHDGKKMNLLDILINYSLEHKRQILMTTHSPTLIEKVPKHSLVSLISENGAVKINNDDISLLTTLTDGQISKVNGSIFITSSKPLIVFEGDSDVKYVKQACKLLNIGLDFELIAANGTGNISSFIKDLKKIVTHRKIYIFVDRDDAGKKAIKAFCDSDEEIKIDSTEVYMKADDDQISIQFLPYKEGMSSGQLLIEGYFSESIFLSKIQSECVAGTSIESNLLNYPQLSKIIKTHISNNYLNFEKEDYSGFKVLLETIDDIYNM